MHKVFPELHQMFCEKHTGKPENLDPSGSLQKSEKLDPSETLQKPENWDPSGTLKNPENQDPGHYRDPKKIGN